MTKVLRYYLLWFLSTALGNPGIPFLAKNKRRKNRFREGFRIIPKYERRNSEKYRMRLNISIIEEHSKFTIILLLFLKSPIHDYLQRPKEVEQLNQTIELHSMLLTIFPFIFWDDPKTFSKSIFSLLVFSQKQNSKITKCSCLRTIAINI